MVIDLDVHGLLDGHSGAMCLTAYNGEAVHTDEMSHGMALFGRWGRGLLGVL